MGIRGKAAAGAVAPAGRDRSAKARLRGWLRAEGDEDAAPSARLEELEREAMLLREENARLKLAREHAADRLASERVRLAVASARGDGRSDEDPWEVLTECMLLRETLLDACRELERGAAELRMRLETLMGDAEGAERASADLEGVT